MTDLKDTQQDFKEQEEPGDPKVGNELADKDPGNPGGGNDRLASTSESELTYRMLLLGVPSRYRSNLRE